MYSLLNNRTLLSERLHATRSQSQRARVLSPSLRTSTSLPWQQGSSLCSCPLHSRTLSSSKTALQAYYRKGPDPGDRVLAALPYLLPLLDGFQYGEFILKRYPYIERAFAPLFPLAFIYNSIPFLPLIVFIGVYAGIINNYSFSRFIRYNAMQAVLLDILLIIPSVIFGTAIHPPSDGLGLEAYISVQNTVFLFVATSVAYGAGSCLVGQTPRLPLVAEAADQQVRDDPGQGF